VELLRLGVIALCGSLPLETFIIQIPNAITAVILLLALLLLLIYISVSLALFLVLLSSKVTMMIVFRARLRM
jgi:hypothetical protein